MIDHTDMKNSKISTTDMNDWVDKADWNNLTGMNILKHLNHTEVDFDMAQKTFFCFQKLFVKIDEKWVTAELMKNINEIFLQHCHNSDISVDSYFMIHNYY